MLRRRSTRFLETRLACLERVLGTLLTFLGNTGILAPEDVAPLVCELEAHRTREEPADGARSHPVPSPPDKPP